MRSLKPISSEGLLYNRIIGTGGIGSGIFFSLAGNETLGREESRMATLLPYKDFCKQHIILHYVSVLLGAGKGKFETLPIGRVGNDDIGKTLLQQMREVGMDTQFVRTSTRLSTLFSVCYQYPDHAGGNITTAESASSEITEEDIEQCAKEIDATGKKEIFLAAPEVPLAARIKLLQIGRERNGFTVASVSSSETAAFAREGGFGLTDLLSVNIDEARSIAGTGNNIPVQEIVAAAVQKIVLQNPSINLLITCGSKGAYAYSNGVLQFFNSLPVQVVSTAGAGDAFLAGCIAGISCGLPLLKSSQEKQFSTATELGVLLAAVSVTSPDTIHAGADAELLHNFIKKNEVPVSSEFLKIFL